ncbi:MAG TPA: hypothetical protein VFH78_10800, partial [Candidatus Thermoplasmatota archaeon]|nr:hypothetical protein [Candidatus Thermoplasmatota archaeon]
ATAFESGALKVLAEGVSTPTDITSLEAAGFPTAWKIDIDLGAPQSAVIPKEESYLVRFKWYSSGPAGNSLYTDDWNVNSGEFFPVSITLPVKNAFDVESVIPQFVHDKLVLLGILNTPWGSYDVDQNSVKLTITDSKGQEVAPVRIEKLADYSVAHGGHYKPVNVTYVWDYLADNLPAGEYQATVRASNFQGSASSSCTGTFVVREGGAAGPIQVGQCGVRTITDEQLQNVQQGSAADASRPSGGDAIEPAPALPLPQVGLFGIPLIVVAARRWRK